MEKRRPNFTGTCRARPHGARRDAAPRSEGVCGASPNASGSLRWRPRFARWWRW
jgi:hypothetical protein